MRDVDKVLKGHAVEVVFELSDRFICTELLLRSCEGMEKEELHWDYVLTTFLVKQ